MASNITISPIAGPVTVSAGGTLLGESRNALEMKEGTYPPVVYVPRGDIDMGKLVRTERATTCPWKGQASYYSITTPDGMRSGPMKSPRPELHRSPGIWHSTPTG